MIFVNELGVIMRSLELPGKEDILNLGVVLKSCQSGS